MLFFLRHGLYPALQENHAPIQNLFPWKTRTKTWLGQGIFYSEILTQKNYQQMKKHTSSLKKRRAIQNFIKKLNGNLLMDPLRELRSSYYKDTGSVDRGSDRWRFLREVDLEGPIADRTHPCTSILLRCGN